ncbi:hypothetical protein GCM10023319_00200 [Nocardia iowensis]
MKIAATAALRAAGSVAFHASRYLATTVSMLISGAAVCELPEGGVCPGSPVAHAVPIPSATIAAAATTIARPGERRLIRLMMCPSSYWMLVLADENDAIAAGQRPNLSSIGTSGSRLLMVGATAARGISHPVTAEPSVTELTTGPIECAVPGDDRVEWRRQV